MGRKKKSKILKIREFIVKIILTYKWLVINSFLHPKEFAKVVSKNKDFLSGLCFGLVNIILWTLIKILITLYPFKTHASLSFIFIDSLIRISILFIIIFFSSLFIFLLSKLLKGTGGFLISLKSIFFATTPLIFFGINILQPLLFLWVIVLLILVFKRTQKYSYLSAAVNIVTPAFFLLLILSSSGLLPNFLPFKF